MHKHQNKTHRMELIDLCADIYAHNELGLEWEEANSYDCLVVANAVINILGIIPEAFQERIDKKINKLRRNED